MTTPNASSDLSAAAAACRRLLDGFCEGLADRLVVPAALAEQALIGTLVGGHLLLEGHPGLGKRTLASATAQLLGLSFSAISCTPDMLPCDLAGSDQVPEDPATGRRCQRFAAGPLFANVAYVEDIHRATPKSLALIVEAMRAGRVGHGGDAQQLPRPFALIASVTPDLADTEQTLDVSVADRFLLQMSFDYPSEREEWEIGRRAGTLGGPKLEPLLLPDQWLALQRAVARVEMPDEVLGYAWALVRATRPGNKLAPDFVETWLRLGVSPQGLVALISAAKARALVRGRHECKRRDVYEIARPVLRHRLGGSEEAMAAGLDVDRLINMLLEQVALDGEYRPEQVD